MLEIKTNNGEATIRAEGSTIKIIADLVFATVAVCEQLSNSTGGRFSKSALEILIMRALSAEMTGAFDKKESAAENG